MNLEGLTAIVTGASRGIGRAVAERLGRDRMNVVVTGRDESLCEEVAAKIVDGGGEAIPVAADLLRGDERQRLIYRAVDHYGKVDVLVNNAGVNRVEPTLDVTEETWDWIIDTNLKAIFFLTQLVAKGMLERGAGRIINIGSEVGVKGYSEHAVYGTSKGGLVLMTKALAVEWGPRGVRVNVVAPGATWTGMTAPAMEIDEVRKAIIARGVVGRISQPEEVAGLVAFMCTDAADMITGQVFSIDGGATA